MAFLSNESALAKHAQMSRDSGSTDAEVIGELTNGHGIIGQQLQDLTTRRILDGREDTTWRVTHGSSIP
jgi:hypothetical protein